MIATARIMMPRARVRLSAGRTELTREAQLLCLYAGANSIFYGERLLTTPNPEEDADTALLRDAGLEPAERRRRAAQSGSGAALVGGKQASSACAQALLSVTSTVRASLAVPRRASPSASPVSASRQTRRRSA
jgi:hypothetical protein